MSAMPPSDPYRYCPAVAPLVSTDTWQAKRGGSNIDGLVPVGSALFNANAQPWMAKEADDSFIIGPVPSYVSDSLSCPRSDSYLTPRRTLSIVVRTLSGKDSMPKWLKCKISKGMFSDEFTAIVTSRTGDVISVFVPRDATQLTHAGYGQVRVRIAEQSGRVMALLPDEYQSIVDVDSSQLVPA